jgi:hypothetical protein
MSFIGLDFGKAANIYADLLRQAHEEKIKQKQWEQQYALQRQQAASLYGFPVEEEYYVPAAIPPMLVGNESLPPGHYSNQGGRIPQSDIGQEVIPSQNEPALSNINRAPDASSRESAIQMSPQKLNQVQETLKPLRREDEIKRQKITSAYDEAIINLVRSAQMSGKMTSDGRVSPDVARRLDELQQLKLKALDGYDRSLYEQAMLAAIREGSKTPPRERVGRNLREESLLNQIRDLKKAKVNLPSLISDPFKRRGYEKLYGVKGPELLKVAEDRIDAQIADLEAQLGIRPKATQAPAVPDKDRLINDLAKKLLDKGKAKNLEDAKIKAGQILNNK